ncbi:MAG TPA: OmpA family protein [Alphaproteobacteria bacterium]|nr:OmpA family protein [Alphaproteobacteria bacterium]
MWRTAAILAAIAAFLYVAVAGVKWLQPRIADDIQGRTTTMLAQHGMLWADVAVDGRTVILSGEAPSAEAAEEAAAAVHGVFGVAVVSNNLVVAEAKPMRKRANSDYQLTINKEGEHLTITGVVPDENTQALLERLAKTHYMDADISSSLVVKAGAPAGWRSAVGTVLFNLTQFENVTATIIGDKIRINGEVLDTTYSDAAAGAIKAAMPTAYNMKMDVEVVTPTEVKVEAAAASPTEPTPATETEAKAEEKAAAIEPAAGEPAKSKLDEVKSLFASKEEPKAEAKAEATAETKAEPASYSCSDMADISKNVVHFDFDSAKLRADQKPVVAKVAGTLKACDNAKVEVLGYTDATGSALYNVWLSEQRAESTVRGMIRQGVKRENTVAKGMGAENPLVPNDTREHRAMNRRVEFKAAQ